ncbi:MAG: T9SS type A sorting domain-containing protein [Balneolaceae bacterium]|nr:T9SS type A sorting domain-containing protein [Balneolaceae bacterium]
MYEPDSIIVNSSTTSNNVLSGINLFLLDISPLSFAEAINKANQVLSELDNTPEIVGGATSYAYNENSDDFTSSMSKTTERIKPIGITYPKIAGTFLYNERISRAKAIHQDEENFPTYPNGYNLMWEVFAYDAVKDSAVGIAVTSFDSQFFGYIGEDEADLPENVSFSDIKPLPNSYIESDAAAEIMENNGGVEFREQFEVSTDQEHGYWEMELQALHEFWTYEPNPTTGAPVMWKGMYYGNLYNQETNVFTEDSLVIYLDIETGEILHQITTSSEGETAIPHSVQLKQNFPNPFNPSTTIPFELSKTANVQIKVYNLLGQQISTLVDGKYPAGNHIVKWDAQNLASGVYIYRLKTEGSIQTRKLVLLK